MATCCSLESGHAGNIVTSGDDVSDTGGVHGLGGGGTGGHHTKTLQGGHLHIK